MLLQVKLARRVLAGLVVNSSKRACNNDLFGKTATSSPFGRRFSFSCHSMFIFKAVPINRDDDNAAFLQASGELNDKMMEFCDTFEDGGDFFGLGRKCHTKLSSNTSVPFVYVEVMVLLPHASADTAVLPDASPLLQLVQSQGRTGEIDESRAPAP